MNPEERVEARFSTLARRRPPGGVHTLQVDLASEGRLPEMMETGRWEVHITATDSEVRLAPWLDEGWWADLIARAPEDHVTVRFAPAPESAATTGCLIHPIVLQHVRMLRRVVPRWRLVGCGHADEVRLDEEVRELAGSMYHEVRIQDRAGSRADAEPCAGGDKRESKTPHDPGCAVSPRTCEQLFADVRRAQAELGVSTPILIRVPSGDGGETHPDPADTDAAVVASTPTSAIQG